MLVLKPDHELVRHHRSQLFDCPAVGFLTPLEKIEHVMMICRPGILLVHLDGGDRLQLVLQQRQQIKGEIGNPARFGAGPVVARS